MPGPAGRDPVRALGILGATLLGFVSLGSGGCTEAGASSDPILIFAAASVEGVVEALADEYRAESGRVVRVNAAASSTLARQIEAGAPADLFIAAHPEWIDHLVALGRLDRTRCRPLARNRLVFVAAPDGPERWPADPERLAIADPDHVPLGRYTRQALTSLGLWDRYRDRLLPALDARAAVEYVRRGEAPVGIVYASDVGRVDPPLRVLAPIEARHHDPIVLTLAIIERDRAEPQRVALEGLVEHLSGPAGVERWRSHGFLPIGSGRR